MAQTRKPNKKCKSKDYALAKYLSFGHRVYNFGFNRTNTVLTLVDSTEAALREKNTLFAGYTDVDNSDKDLIFTELSSKTIDKKVSLAVNEIDHATKGLGLNVFSNVTRDFVFPHSRQYRYGRDSFNCYDERKFVLEYGEQPNVFAQLESWGLLSEQSCFYKPWLYAIHKDISLSQFGQFVEDLRESYIDIGLSGLNSQEYLMRRLDGFSRGYGHIKVMETVTNKTDSYNTLNITVMAWPDWWNFRLSKQGVLRTYETKSAFISFYGENATEREYLSNMLDSYVKSTNYSLDLCATLALIELLKDRQRKYGFTKPVKTYIASEFGLTPTQINKLYDIRPTQIYNMGLTIYVLPNYNGKTYLDLEDLCNNEPKVTLDGIIANMRDLLNGDSLTGVFRPKDTLLSK